MTACTKNFFSGLSAVIFLLITAGLAINLALAQDSDSPEYAPDEVLVKFKSSTARQKIDQINRHIKAEIIETFRGDPDLYLVRIPEGVRVASALAYYGNDPDVEHGEPNWFYYPTLIPNDPRFGELWGLQRIQAPAAWDILTEAPDVIIAVTDSGGDYNHPDLSANIGPGWNFIENNDDTRDLWGHGTAVTGILAAVGNNGIGVVGVLWRAQIMPLTIGTSYYFAQSRAIKAIDYAIENGARVINASWGAYHVGSGSPNLRSAIARAEAAGLLYIAGAGNDALDLDGSGRPFYPCAFDLANIICVAATAPNDALTDFSNYGAVSVDLAAPGVNILTTERGGGYWYTYGTSMATPHVAGAAALIWGYNPKLTAAQVKAIVLNSVDVVPALQGRTVTGGRLNLRRALEMTSEGLP